MRTQAEKDATEAIEAAIESYRVAYRLAHPESNNGTLTDWVVIAAETNAVGDDAEDDITSYSIMMNSGATPWHRSRGLLEAGIHFMEGQIHED